MRTKQAFLYRKGNDAHDVNGLKKFFSNFQFYGRNLVTFFIILLSVCGGLIWYNWVKVESSTASFLEIKHEAYERPAFENHTGTRLDFVRLKFRTEIKPLKNPRRIHFLLQYLKQSEMKLYQKLLHKFTTQVVYWQTEEKYFKTGAKKDDIAKVFNLLPATSRDMVDQSVM